MIDELQYHATQLADLWQYKIAAGITVGTVATVFGIDATMLLCISALMFADIAVGVVAAWKSRSFRAERLSRGVMKFFAYYLSMFLISIVDRYTASSIGIQFPIQNLYVTYLIATEVISIINHCSALGLPFPPLFNKIIKGYHTRMENAVNSIVDHHNKEGTHHDK